MRDDLKEIKKRIVEEDRIEELLNELGCEYVEKRGERWEAQLPERFGSTNKRAVQVYENDNLSSFVRNKGFKGDIYGLVGFLEYDIDDFDLVKENLFQIKAIICNSLGYEEYLEKGDDFEEKPDYNDYLFFLRDVQKERKQRQRLNQLTFKENKVRDESIMNRFVHYPHHKFLKDGIGIETQRKFGVCFDPMSERVVYPVHNKDGGLIGTKGRYVGNNKAILDRVKYIYLHPCDKSIELYNYHRAYDHIIESNEVIVFESAKSCMLADQYGYKNSVSIEGSEVSPIQAHMLKKLGVVITFAFDHDMDTKIIRKNINQIKNRIKKVVKDDGECFSGTLSGKDAPIDRGKDLWAELYGKRAIFK